MICGSFHKKAGFSDVIQNRKSSEEEVFKSVYFDLCPLLGNTECYTEQSENHFKKYASLFFLAWAVGLEKLLS